MSDTLLHTPDGVRDIYNTECEKKLTVEARIQKVLHLYGYQSIETPTFEFFDIFKKERGSVVSSEMFKFFDRDNNTLVLRPDVTPSIARCVAKYFSEESMPLRLCYLERTFINNSSYQGRLKESTQTGAELIGDDSSDADSEMIAMVIDSLKAAGLTEFQVELGQVDFFTGILEEAGMDKEKEDELIRLIKNKNYFGVEELVLNQPMRKELRESFLRLPEFFGSIEKIKQAKELVLNEKSLHAIDRLEKIHNILETYGLAGYVSYDLGILSNYKYYTGLIFKAYTYGTGDYIVTGGRYDKLILQFGKDAPAVGFAIVIDRLMQALSRQKIEVPVNMVNTMVLYDAESRLRAIKLAVNLRNGGMQLQLVRKSSRKNISEYKDFAVRSHLRNIMYLKNESSDVSVIDVTRDKTDIIPYTEYVKEV